MELFFFFVLRLPQKNTVKLVTSELHFSDIVENIFYDVGFLLILGADTAKEHGSTSTRMPLIATC